MADYRLVPRQVLPPRGLAATSSGTSDTATSSNSGTSASTPVSTPSTTSSSDASTSSDASRTTGGTTSGTTTAGGSSSGATSNPSLSSTTSTSSPNTPSSLSSLSSSLSSSSSTNPSGVVTVTSVQVASSLPTVAPPVASSASSTSQGFFQNKAAVAGVFTIVGLIGLVILIAVIMNVIRRRRAQEFDREIAEAAAEAAAARAPAFLDDDNENYGPGYAAGGAYGKYSDASHGTYAQPPMSEAYNMRQMGPSPGDIYDTSVYTAAGAAGAGAGAAGIGVARARSRRDGAFAAGLQEGTSPYPAFAGPQYNDGYNNSQSPPPDFRSPDIEADLAALGGAAVGRGFSQQTHQTGYSSTSRNRSSNDGHSTGNVPLALQPRVQHTSVSPPPPPVVPTILEDPSTPDPLPNPFSATTESHDIPEDDESVYEEEPPRPVLRVANE